MISKIRDIPIFGTCFSLSEKHVNTPHIFDYHVKSKSIIKKNVPKNIGAILTHCS